MFKLTKILNAKCNVPEYCLLPADPSVSYIKGSALVFKDGALRYARDGEIPTHICATNCAPGEEAEILSFEIKPDMVFEGLTKETYKLVGTESFSVTADKEHGARLVRDENGVIELFELPDTDRENKIAVRFNI